MNKRLSIFRILLHGFFLISVNLFSMIAAFAIIQFVSTDTDKIIQSFIALIINVGIYIFVFRLMNGIQEEIMKIDDFSMFAIILLVSLALLPAIFYPMHYLTQGNWSSFDNLLATWPYQVVVNGLCLVINFFIMKRKSV